MRPSPEVLNPLRIFLIVSSMSTDSSSHVPEFRSFQERFSWLAIFCSNASMLISTAAGLPCRVIAIA